MMGPVAEGRATAMASALKLEWSRAGGLDCNEDSLLAPPENIEEALAQSPSHSLSSSECNADEDEDDDAAKASEGTDSGYRGGARVLAEMSNQSGGSVALNKRMRESEGCDLVLKKACPRVVLAKRAVVVADQGRELADLGEAEAQPLSQLEFERRRVMGVDGDALVSPRISIRNLSDAADWPLHKQVLKALLRPKDWAPPAPDEPFFLQASTIDKLCTAVESVLQAEPTVLRLRAPVKIYGDLHGQFGDLMRMFEAYGAPSRDAIGGDINLVDYLFLGDYVDRGMHSLETVCLLFALKVEYPQNVHLLRGNHESDQVNRFMGLYDECVERLGQEKGEEVWIRLNDVFDWLPLAAVVQDRILCLHAGIGRSIRSISDVEAVHRPCTVLEGGDLLTDLLWSDPTDHDSIVGIHDNDKRGPGVVAYGPDKVREFCENNGLDLIIRGHECIMDGIERFASGHLMTVFSATNYCGVTGNKGALLLVGRDLTVTPKLIQPAIPVAPPSPPTPFPGHDAVDPSSRNPFAYYLNSECGDDDNSLDALARAGAQDLCQWRAGTSEKSAPTPVESLARNEVEKVPNGEPEKDEFSDSFSNDVGCDDDADETQEVDSE